MYESWENELYNVSSVDDLNVLSIWKDINKLTNEIFNNPYVLAKKWFNKKDFWYIIALSNPEYDDIFEIIKYNPQDNKGFYINNKGEKWIRIIDLDRVVNSILLQKTVYMSSPLIRMKQTDNVYQQIINDEE